MLARAGVPVRRGGRPRDVSRASTTLALDAIHVPGDPSSAAFHAAAAVLVPGSRIVVEGMAANWTRVGFFRILERMGGDRRGRAGGARRGARPTPSRVVRPRRRARRRCAAPSSTPDEVPLAIDELPLVALLGCFAEGETVVRGAQELRVKESDRIATVVDGLRGLGADIEATDDGFAVRGTGGLRGGAIDAHGDHRLAMLGAVAGLAAAEGVEVDRDGGRRGLLSRLRARPGHAPVTALQARRARSAGGQLQCPAGPG